MMVLKVGLVFLKYKRTSLMLLMVTILVLSMIMPANVWAITYGFLFKFGSPGSGDGHFENPSGVAVDSSNRIIVTDTGNARIQVFGPTTTGIPDFPFSYSLVIMFVVVAAVYVVIRQKMIPIFKRF